MENIYTTELRKLVEEIPNTSAWKRGVKEYADELLDNLEEKAQSYERLPKNGRELEEWILNGARSWDDYSYGGCSLIYDRDIAERLCTQSELKKEGWRKACTEQSRELVGCSDKGIISSMCKNHKKIQIVIKISRRSVNAPPI